MSLVAGKLRFNPRAVAVILILSATGFATRPAADDRPAAVVPAATDAATTASALPETAARGSAEARVSAWSRDTTPDEADHRARLAEPAGESAP